MNNKMIRQGLAIVTILAMAIVGVLISVGSENTLAAFGAKVDNTNNYTSIPEDPCSVPNTLPEPLFHYSLAGSSTPQYYDLVPDLTPGNDDGQFLGTVFAQNIPGPCNSNDGSFYFPGPASPGSTATSPWGGHEIRSGTSDLTNPTVFTVAGWFREDRQNTQTLPNFTRADNYGGVLAQFGGGTNSRTGGDPNVNRTRTVLLDESGRLVFWVGSRGPGTFWNWNTWQVEPTYTTVSIRSGVVAAAGTNQWHHFAATFGPGGMRLYVDGTLRASNNNTTVAAQNGRWYFADGRKTYRGDNSLDPWNQFEGNMKHIAYWQQVLTPAQIATLASTAS